MSSYDRVIKNPKKESNIMKHWKSTYAINEKNNIEKAWKECFSKVFRRFKERSKLTTLIKMGIMIDIYAVIEYKQNGYIKMGQQVSYQNWEYIWGRSLKTLVKSLLKQISKGSNIETMFCLHFLECLSDNIIEIPISSPMEGKLVNYIHSNVSQNKKTYYESNIENDVMTIFGPSVNYQKNNTIDNASRNGSTGLSDNESNNNSVYSNDRYKHKKKHSNIDNESYYDSENENISSYLHPRKKYQINDYSDNNNNNDNDSDIHSNIHDNDIIDNNNDNDNVNVNDTNINDDNNFNNDINNDNTNDINNSECDNYERNENHHDIDDDSDMDHNVNNIQSSKQSIKSRSNKSSKNDSIYNERYNERNNERNNDRIKHIKISPNKERLELKDFEDDLNNKISDINIDLDALKDTVNDNTNNMKESLRKLISKPMGEMRKMVDQVKQSMISMWTDFNAFKKNEIDERKNSIEELKIHLKYEITKSVEYQTAVRQSNEAYDKAMKHIKSNNIGINLNDNNGNKERNNETMIQTLLKKNEELNNELNEYKHLEKDLKEFKNDKIAFIVEKKEVNKSLNEKDQDLRDRVKQFRQTTKETYRSIATFQHAIWKHEHLVKQGIRSLFDIIDTEFKEHDNVLNKLQKDDALLKMKHIHFHKLPKWSDLKPYDWEHFQILKRKNVIELIGYNGEDIPFNSDDECIMSDDEYKETIEHSKNETNDNEKKNVGGNDAIQNENENIDDIGTINERNNDVNKVPKKVLNKNDKLNNDVINIPEITPMNIDIDNNINIDNDMDMNMNINQIDSISNAELDVIHSPNDLKNNKKNIMKSLNSILYNDDNNENIKEKKKETSININDTNKELNKKKEKNNDIVNENNKNKKKKSNKKESNKNNDRERSNGIENNKKDSSKKNDRERSNGIENKKNDRERSNGIENKKKDRERSNGIESNKKDSSKKNDREGSAGIKKDRERNASVKKDRERSTGVKKDRERSTGVKKDRERSTGVKRDRDNKKDREKRNKKDNERKNDLKKDKNRISSSRGSSKQRDRDRRERHSRSTRNNVIDDQFSRMLHTHTQLQKDTKVCNHEHNLFETFNNVNQHVNQYLTREV